MAALLPVLPGQETDQASVMAWGCDPDQLSGNPYQGAYEAVTVSIAKLVAAGADYKNVYLTLQEFFMTASARLFSTAQAAFTFPA